MQVEIIPVQERLQRLKDHYPAHDEFPVCAIWSFANLQMAQYLGQHEEQAKTLSAILELPMGELEVLTYREVACLIQELHESSALRELADEAAELLAQPLIQHWKGVCSRGNRS